MSFLKHRRPKTEDGPSPRRTSLGSSTLSRVFTKSMRSKKSRVVSDSVAQTTPPGWLAGAVENRSSISSGSPSVEEIRRPSGLGERADSMASARSVGTVGSIPEVVVVGVGRELRPQSISQPNLPFLQNQTPLQSRPRGVSTTTADTTSIIEYDSSDPQYFVNRVPPVPSRRTEFPAELLTAVCGFLSRHELTSVARASASFLVETRKLLYETLDLQNLPQERVHECLEVLVSKRDIASTVRHFASSWLPSYVENDSPLSFITFSLALHNMSRLTSLSLPRFDSNLLHHTNFSLERATFLSEVMSEPEQKLFSTWIASQGELVSLSLPSLTTEITITPVIRASVVHDGGINLGNLSFPTPPAQNLVLPKLTRFDGPACLVPSLVPGRPVTEVVLHVQKTLYDGLKPSAMMASLAKSLAPITRLSIASSSKVDARTLERLLMSAGADIGSSVRTLEVDWMLDDDVCPLQLSRSSH